MITVSSYSPADRAAWNELVHGSKNGTFLFDRGYMEYHADRFTDASLVFRDNGRVVGVLPACRRDDELLSHAGLTYGGLVLRRDAPLCAALDAFAGMLRHCADAGVRRISYKTVPTIYHDIPADEDRYALFRAGARLVRRDAWPVIDMAAALPVQERRRRALKRARAAGLEVAQSDDWTAFWTILTENLMRRYGVRPVHTVEEITTLARRFPANIQLTAACAGGRMLAGIVTYTTPKVVHVQYPGVSEEGMTCGALDAIHFALCERFATTHRYYDFGGVTEEAGRRLNRGLLEFKEGFGARVITHDTYDIDVDAALSSYGDV
ncbi:MAG TPA: GNAT family N-acetyltransferase [Gemmatimonadaceae bacterium]|nr:GNAT family N-acetyltransferase [Gemmatimonadaceae bacterium]